MPFDANSETSGISRTPSFGFPTRPLCHWGFGYPLQVPPTTPATAGEPRAQPLGPPLPPKALRKKLSGLVGSVTSLELQNAVGVVPPYTSLTYVLAHEPFQGISWI